VVEPSFAVPFTNSILSPDLQTLKIRGGGDEGFNGRSNGLDATVEGR
jgi:hypothetical protein